MENPVTVNIVMLLSALVMVSFVLRLAAGSVWYTREFRWLDKIILFLVALLGLSICFDLGLN
jgi:hypothetical protein